MPTPKRDAAAAADPHPVPAARPSTPAATRPSARVGDVVEVSATSSATATTSCAPSSATGRPVRRVARGRAARRSTRTTTACAGAAASRSTRWAAGSSRSRPGPTCFATWRDELRRKVEAGQDELAGELSEGVVLLARRRRERAEGADRKLIEHALRVLADADDPRGRQARRRAGHRAVRRRRAQRGAPRPRPSSSRRWRSRSTACARASAPGTSSSRARGAASQGVQEQLPAARRARLRRPLPAADPPDRR